ncbi:F-box protein-like protein [Tanacetum coccineum]
MSKNRVDNAEDNYAQPHAVLTNDDLLTEILIRLPILCFRLFTTVSKQWLRILTSPDFTRNRRQIPNLDPLDGLFASHIKHPFICDLVSFDSRIQSRKCIVENIFTLASTEADYSHDDSPYYLNVGLIMAFDPTKSLNYKVVHAGQTSSHIDIRTYCSETGNWSLCKDWFSFFDLFHFKRAIYLNGALHWLQMAYFGLKHYKLNIEDHDHPILTSIQIGQGLHRVRHFFEPFGNNLPSCIATRLGQRFHDEVKLFESRGCLLVVLRDYYGSREFTIYEMRKGCSVWSVRYLVNTDDFMNPLLEGWSICSTVWSIVLGEREEDSCLVINLSGKVVEYNLISKTLHEIYDIGSNQLDDNRDDDELIMPFEADHNVYEFIPSFASV